MHNYIFLAVGRVGSSTDLIMQHVEFVQGNDKRQVLLDLINTVEVRSPLPCSFLTCWLKAFRDAGRPGAAVEAGI